MILINHARYTINYRMLKIDATKIQYNANVMLIIWNSICIVYKNGCLIGSIFTNVINTKSAYNGRHISKTNWDRQNICGYYAYKHNVPFYNIDDNTLSIYGFKVSQYAYDLDHGGFLDQDLCARMFQN